MLGLRLEPYRGWSTHAQEMVIKAGNGTSAMFFCVIQPNELRWPGGWGWLTGRFCRSGHASSASDPIIPVIGCHRVYIYVCVRLCFNKSTISLPAAPWSERRTACHTYPSVEPLTLATETQMGRNDRRQKWSDDGKPSRNLRDDETQPRHG